MKTEFLTKLLVNYAIIVIGFAAIPFMLDAIFGFRLIRVTEVVLIQILIATIAIRFSVLATRLINFKTLIAKYILDYFVISANVYLFGWFWGWYTRDSILLFFVIFTVVFIAGAILDLGHIRKDVTFINKQIKLRQQRKKNQIEQDCPTEEGID